jgi:hypothetical protein
MAGFGTTPGMQLRSDPSQAPIWAAVVCRRNRSPIARSAKMDVHASEGQHFGGDVKLRVRFRYGDLHS